MRRIALLAALAVVMVSCGSGTDTAVPPEDEVWRDGSVALVAGDCFDETNGDSVVKVDCASPHDAEVTHVKLCELGTQQDDKNEISLAAAANYVGVEPEAFIDWLGAEGLNSLMTWSLNPPSLCYLKAIDGQLTKAYGS